VLEKYVHKSRKKLIFKKNPARIIGKGLYRMKIYNGIAPLMSKRCILVCVSG